MATKKTPKKSGTKAIHPDPLLFSVLEARVRKGDLKKAQIIESAIEVMAQEGIESLTFERIGKKLGMLKAHVAYHFKSKQNIIDQAIEYISANAQKITVEKIQKATSPQEQLEALIDAPFDWAEKHPAHVKVFILNSYYCSLDPKRREAFAVRRKMGEERLSAVLKIIGNSNPDAGKTVQVILSGMMIEAFTVEATDKSALDRYRKMAKKTILELITK